MKKLISVSLIIIFCLFFSASCGEDNSETVETLQKQIQKERQAREAAEKKVMEAQKEVSETKSSFYLWVGIGVSLIILALLFGVAMGSKAKKDANKS